MSNEKAFNSEPEKERIFNINDELLSLIAAALIAVNVYLFAALGCVLFKMFGLGKFWIKVGGYLGAVAGLVFTGFLSNSIRNWGLRRLEERELKEKENLKN